MHGCQEFGRVAMNNDFLGHVIVLFPIHLGLKLVCFMCISRVR